MARRSQPHQVVRLAIVPTSIDVKTGTVGRLRRTAAILFESFGGAIEVGGPAWPLHESGADIDLEPDDIV